MIEQANFIYSPLGKTLEKQLKTIDYQEIKQVKALKALKSEEELESIEGLFPKYMRTDEIKNEIDEIKKWKDKIKRKDLKYKTGKYKVMIRSFGESIYSGKISIHETDMNQTNLLDNMKKINDRSRPKTKEKVRINKRNTFDSVSALYEG